MNSAKSSDQPENPPAASSPRAAAPLLAHVRFGLSGYMQELAIAVDLARCERLMQAAALLPELSLDTLASSMLKNWQVSFRIGEAMALGLKTECERQQGLAGGQSSDEIDWARKNEMTIDRVRWRWEDRWGDATSRFEERDFGQKTKGVKMWLELLSTSETALEELVPVSARAASAEKELLGAMALAAHAETTAAFRDLFGEEAMLFSSQKSASPGSWRESELDAMTLAGVERAALREATRIGIPGAVEAEKSAPRPTASRL